MSKERHETRLVCRTDPFALADLLSSNEQLIYFIQKGESGPIKIGVSSQVGARLKQLQTGHDELLRLVGLMKGGFFNESQIHSRFAPLRMCGEWFSPTLELREFVLENSLMHGNIGVPNPKQPKEADDGVIVIDCEVYEHLGPLHRATADLLIAKGKCRIVDRVLER